MINVADRKTPNRASMFFQNFYTKKIGLIKITKIDEITVEFKYFILIRNKNLIFQKKH